MKTKEKFANTTNELSDIYVTGDTLERNNFPLAVQGNVSTHIDLDFFKKNWREIGWVAGIAYAACKYVIPAL